MTSIRKLRPARPNTRARLRRRVVRRALTVLVLLPFAKAGTTGVRFAADAAGSRRRGVAMFPDVPTPSPTPALAASVALDELFMMPTGLFASIATSKDYQESSAELDAAAPYYEKQGWVQNPATYFQAPPPLRDVHHEQVVFRRRPLEVIRFRSEWEPRDDEPGRDRWLSLTANQDAYATVLRHPDGPRPWLICVHGSGMGRLGDLDSFKLRRIHTELGVNLLLPILPLHGHRRVGMRPRHQFVSSVYPLNNVFGMAQAIWDVRRIVSWLRLEQQATQIGLFGFSLGSYVVSTLSTVEGDFQSLVAVVPSGDIAAPLKATEPAVRSLRRQHVALHDSRAALVQNIVSPLAGPCLVPVERRYIVAAQGDRLATASGGAMLWRHWDKPRIDWYPRGHLTLAQAPGYEPRLEAVLRADGLVAG